MPGNIIVLIVITIMCFIITGSNGPAQNLSFPPLTGRVVDNAHVLDASSAAQLAEISQNLETQTGAQLVVATIPDLQGTSIEDYGYQLGRAWAIGRKGYDDGVLLLVAPADREVRIEVGYGLEGILTDAASRVIIENEIIPQFKAGDMPKGIVNGATAIATMVSDPDYKADLPTQGTVAPDDYHQGSAWTLLQMLFIPILIGLFPLFSIFSWIRSLIDPAYGAQMVALPRLTHRGWRGGGWGGPGGGGRSGGGFSGGGGSFGGGGASGRW